jgi:hypothetical protein
MSNPAFSLCGVPFKPSGFILLCEDPFDPVGSIVQTRLAELTGCTFTVIPIQRYLFNQNMHGEESGQTSRVPICVGCNIESIFGDMPKGSSIKTEGASVRLSDEKAARAWLDQAFQKEEIATLNAFLD